MTSKKGNVKESVFHVKNRKKIRKKGKGLQLELFCPHQSSNRLGVKISLANRRESGAQTLEDAINQVNAPENRGSKDPEIVIEKPFNLVTKRGNRLDVTIANNYIFESVPLQKVIDTIIEKEGNVVSGGGAFQYHYFRFVSLYDHAAQTNLDKIGIQVFEQGFMRNPSNGEFEATPQVTLVKNTNQSGLRSDVNDLDGLQEPEVGTNLVAVGNKTSGSYLKEYSIFQGEKDAFRLVKFWADATEYKANQRVRYQNAFYKAVIAHTSNNGVNDPINGLGVFWTVETFTPSVDYSPETKDKAQYWINSLAGAKYANTPGGRTCMVDFNCVIKDPKHWREDVDCVENDSVKVLLKTDLMLNGLPYHGFRVLVVDPATGSGASGFGDFAGTDRNGLSYANNIAQYDDPDFDGIGEWIVVRETETDDEIVDWEECLAWTYNKCSGLLIAGTPKDTCTLGSRSGIWEKGSYGFTPGIGGTGVGANWRANVLFDCFHPVKRNGSGVVEVGNERISNDDTGGTSAVFINFDPQESQLTAVAGFNFHMLFPYSANGIPFGVVNVGERKGLPVFDFNNMNYNHNRKRVWFGEDVVDYFPIQGFRFWEYLQELLPLSIVNPTGNYNMAIWLMDINRNKVILEYIHGANDTRVPQDVPIGKKKNQLSVQGVKSFIQSQEVEDNVIFDWREVVKGGIVTKDSYDAQWKYISPASTITTLLTINSRFFNTEKIHLAIDAWRMNKPLVATNVKDASKPERNIMPQLLKHDEVVSLNQLQNIVDAEELVFNFEAETFSMERPARNDLSFGDPVYYTDSEAIDITTDSLPNTVKAVVDREVITFSKPIKGPGGMVSKVYVKTRLFP